MGACFSSSQHRQMEGRKPSKRGSKSRIEPISVVDEDDSGGELVTRKHRRSFAMSQDVSLSPTDFSKFNEETRGQADDETMREVVEEEGEAEGEAEVEYVEVGVSSKRVAPSTRLARLPSVESSDAADSVLATHSSFGSSTGSSGSSSTSSSPDASPPGSPSSSPPPFFEDMDSSCYNLTTMQSDCLSPRKQKRRSFKRKAAASAAAAKAHQKKRSKSSGLDHEALPGGSDEPWYSTDYREPGVHERFQSDTGFQFGDFKAVRWAQNTFESREELKNNFQAD